MHEEMSPATWNLAEPGSYTLQIVGPKAGAALDAFVLQLNSNGAACGIRAGAIFDHRSDGVFLESGGVLVVEGEDVSRRTAGSASEWVVVPGEGASRVTFLNPTGGAYLQVLPDRATF